MSHFRYWLCRIQGKENCQIPATQLHLIVNELGRSPRLPITYERIRMVLKRLKLQRLYNNVYFIMKQLTGTALVELESHHETELVELFRRVQTPFAVHRGVRVNMLSYFYLIKKFCEILGWDDLAAGIDNIKAVEKLRQQDIIWQRICDELHLPFYRSV